METFFGTIRLQDHQSEPIRRQKRGPVPEPCRFGIITPNMTFIAMIERDLPAENARRTEFVFIHVAGRGPGGYVGEVQRVVAMRVPLPPGRAVRIHRAGRLSSVPRRAR